MICFSRCADTRWKHLKEFYMCAQFGCFWFSLNALVHRPCYGWWRAIPAGRIWGSWSFFNSSSFINTSILFDAAFLEIMRRLFLFYKPSGSPFLRSGQERVLQSLLCSVGPWVRSYLRILSAVAVSPCQMGVRFSRCIAWGPLHLKNRGRFDFFCTGEKKYFICYDLWRIKHI